MKRSKKSIAKMFSHVCLIVRILLFELGSLESFIFFLRVGNGGRKMSMVFAHALQTGWMKIRLKHAGVFLKTKHTQR